MQMGVHLRANVQLCEPSMVFCSTAVEDDIVLSGKSKLYNSATGCGRIAVRAEFQRLVNENMDKRDLSICLERLIAAWESEVVEFKQADQNYSTDKIGRYFSALANEANLRQEGSAWLVFGVSDKTRSVVGTNYRENPEQLQSIKHQIADSSEPSITFRNVFELQHELGRVVMFQIPAAPLGLPISWKGHYYARAGESVTNLGIDKLDAIRQQTLNMDWSAQVVPNATLDDLDPSAVQQARQGFALKHANRIPKDEVLHWPLPTFLDRAKLTLNGSITRAALLLLGKSESDYLLSPHLAQLTWKLVGPESAYEHFGVPFLVSTTELYRRIRNIQVRLLPDNQLVAVEVSKYDQEIMLEALHNCIAHQDYTQCARIIVTEHLD